MGGGVARHLGDLQDVLLHETAVAVVKDKLAQGTPKAAWRETPAEFYVRLREVGPQITAKGGMDSLCRREWPQRIHDLVHDPTGDRLGK